MTILKRGAVLGAIAALFAAHDAGGGAARDSTKPSAVAVTDNRKPPTENQFQQRRRATRRAAQPTRRPRRGRRAVAAIPPMPRTSPRSVDQLRADLGGMLTRRVRSGQWGVAVMSVTRGDTLFTSNADLPMLPASVMKLFTSAVALERLGPLYRFSTDVLRSGDVDSEGTLHGNLYIRGDGDPTFSRRFHPGPYSEPVDKLARLVAEAGIRRVTGAVVGDANAFDPEMYPAGWLTRYQGAGYAARVSPLSLNENVVWVTVAPGRAGQPAAVTLEPATTTIPLRGSIRTVSGGGTAVRAANAADGSITVRGSIGARSPVRRFGLVVLHPPRFTTGAFHAALLAKGIRVDGGARLGVTPDDAHKIGWVVSPPLDQIVTVMNRESINLFAELLFRNAVRGRERRGQASTASAQALLREFLEEEVNTNAARFLAADGSGLSTLDRMTGRQMVGLLDYAHGAPWGPTLHASLPVAGQSELLRRRMKLSPADGNLHAKTGTTNAVMSLAGYVTSEGGEVIAFSFVYNGSDRWNARSTMDVMGETLAGFARP